MNCRGVQLLPALRSAQSRRGTLPTENLKSKARRAIALDGLLFRHGRYVSEIVSPLEKGKGP